MSSQPLNDTVKALLAEQVEALAQAGLAWAELPCERRGGLLLPLLHALQQRLGSIPPEAVPLLAEALDRSRAEVQGVIDHYPDFRQQALPAPRLRVCRSEACLAMGGEALWAAAQRADGQHPEPVYCLGLCACAPAFELEGSLHARATPESLRRALDAMP